MYQIIVLKNGEIWYKITGDSFVLGVVNSRSGRCTTKRAGSLALCSFAAMALFAEASDTLKGHLAQPAGSSSD